MWTRVQEAKNTTIKIKSIWIPHLGINRSKLRDSILKHSCNVQILLAHPDLQDAFEFRSRQIGNYSQEEITKLNRDTMEDCLWIYEQIIPKNPLLKDKIELRLHKNFIGHPLLAIGDTVYLAQYLPENPSYENPILKLTDPSKPFTQKILESFDYDWKPSDKSNVMIIDFSNSEHLALFFNSNRLGRSEKTSTEPH